MIAQVALAVYLDTCNDKVSPNITDASKPFTIQWTAEEPRNYDGFSIRKDKGPELNVGMATVLGFCPAGTVLAGNKVYQYRTGGMLPGTHTLYVWSWRYERDPVTLLMKRIPGVTQAIQVTAK